MVSNVRAEVGNNAPVVVTEAETDAVEGRDYAYDIDALDPERRPLWKKVTAALGALANRTRA